MLSALLRNGDDGIEPDAARATQLMQLLATDASWKLPKVPLYMWSVAHREAREQNDSLVEQILRNGMVQSRCCFLLTLGGPDRGKSSVVHSLRGMDFVEDHIETELYDLRRVIIAPEESLDESELTQMVENSETLFAALTRAQIGWDFLIEFCTPAASRGNETPDEAQPGLVAGHTAVRGAVIVRDRSREGGLATLSNVEVNSNSSLNWSYLLQQPRAISGIIVRGRDDLGVPLAEIAQQVRKAPPMSSHPPEGHLKAVARIPTNVRDRVLFNARNAIGANPFPDVQKCALVQCWDAGGQHPYRMAQTIFIRRASILVFVVNLEHLAHTEKRDEEVRELCEWMELAHARVVEPAQLQPIIVGTRKASCGDEQACWNFLKKRFVYELGTDCYNAWVKKCKGNSGLIYIGVENRTARSDPVGSGTRQLEEAVKHMADSIVNDREAIPANWMALVEELESIPKCVFLTKGDVIDIVKDFPGFEGSRDQKWQDAADALRYFAGTGRLLLLEEDGKNPRVFMSPERIIDFVRMVTGSEQKIEQRLARGSTDRVNDERFVLTGPATEVQDELEQEDARALEGGMLSRVGLSVLWQDYPEEERDDMLILLCRFDLLMKVPGEHAGEMIAIPALLPTTGELKWTKTAGVSELYVRTDFPDVFLPGLISVMIAHLHRTVGAERTKAEFIRSVAILLTVGGTSPGEKGRVLMDFDRKERKILWTVRAPARKLKTHMKKCLKAFEECLDVPVRRMRIRREHFLVSKCEAESAGCGKEGGMEFELDREWIMSAEAESRPLPNVEGQCSSCGSRSDLEEWALVTNDDGERPRRSRIPLIPDDVVVFISHAGQQKSCVAQPLQKSLEQAGFYSFLDVRDLRVGLGTVGEQLREAMRYCNVGVFVLSPEFVSKNWPMAELHEMLELKRRAEEAGKAGPSLYPLFYGLTVEKCKQAELLPGRYGATFAAEGFFEEDRQEVCSTSDMVEAVRGIARYPGLVRGEMSNREYVMQAALDIGGSYRRNLLQASPGERNL